MAATLAKNVLSRVRGRLYRAYYRVARANYERGWFTRRNRTPAGSIHSYEPITRHGVDPMLEELDAACSETAVVYDVGANVGIYACALAVDTDRRLVAFEPAPTTREHLRATVRRNDLEDRIESRGCGLGAETGEAPFYCSSHPELSAFDPESATRWEAEIVDEVVLPCYRLDDLIDALPAPDVIKLDVEGTAPDVLRGARRTLASHRPLVFLEVHADGLEGDRPREARAILEARGYRVLEREGFWRCEPGA